MRSNSLVSDSEVTHSQTCWWTNLIDDELFKKSNLSKMLLNNLPESIFFIDAAGYVITANPAGWRFIQKYPTIQRATRINVAQIFDDPWAKNSLQRALEDKGYNDFTLHRSDGKRPYLVRIAKVFQDDYTYTGIEQVVTCLYVIDTEYREEFSTKNLAKAMGLTPAETGVALLLAQGISDQAIAAQLGKQLTTVRSHVRSIMSKCGVTSRAMFAHRFTAMV